jgi:uncharacterized membrane protein
MESNMSMIEPMLERAKEYGKTSFELYKLKSLDKTAEVLSQLISRLMLLFVVFIFLIAFNIALGLWLGELFGKTYYGFILLALIYGIIASIVYYKHPIIKSKVNDRIISILIN